MLIDLEQLNPEDAFVSAERQAKCFMNYRQVTKAPFSKRFLGSGDQGPLQAHGIQLVQAVRNGTEDGDRGASMKQIFVKREGVALWANHLGIYEFQGGKRSGIKVVPKPTVGLNHIHVEIQDVSDSCFSMAERVGGDIHGALWANRRNKKPERMLFDL